MGALEGWTGEGIVGGQALRGGGGGGCRSVPDPDPHNVGKWVQTGGGGGGGWHKALVVGSVSLWWRLLPLNLLL